MVFRKANRLPHQVTHPARDSRLDQSALQSAEIRSPAAARFPNAKPTE